jgi:ubiquinone/menaquinone biosynthesis C-methylase UbiE
VSDLSLVTDVDDGRRILAVTSLEREASLNANIAHLAFRYQSDVQYIVHSHIEIPGAIHAAAETAPGTQDDWESVADLIRSGERLIYQKNHGIVLLLRELSELLPILKNNNVCGRHAEIYDLAYSRFRNSERFVELIVDSLTTESRVLDLAAGTGEVSRQLLPHGFRDLVLMDFSPEMLRVARQKLRSLSDERFVCAPMELFSDSEAYDGIVIRQPINGLVPFTLVPTLSRLRKALKPGGKLLFNSFLFEPNHSPSVQSFRHEIGDSIVVTLEGNDLTESAITHGHRAEIFHKDGGYDLVYDLTHFSIFSEVQFAQACSEAGFSRVSVLHEAQSLYLISEK